MVRVIRAGGFTLIEIMLVILLMGTVASFVVFNAIGSDPQKELEKEVKRFEVVVSMASDFAVLNQQQLGVRIDKQQNQYVFLLLDENDVWREISQDKVFSAYPLPEQFSLKLVLDDLPWEEEDNLFSDGIFDEESSFDQDIVQIGDEEEKPPKPPQIFLLSSGEITPFSVEFIYEPQFSDHDPSYFKVNGIDSLPLEREGPLESL